MPTLLDAALDYAARGWPVLALRPATKVPALLNGLDGATTDAGTLRGWWGRCPTLNIGVRTGAASRLVVIDIDCKHGIDGFGSWCQLMTRLGIPWHETFTTLTPTGGFHRFYEHPSGVEIHGRVGRLGPGLDVRADRNYVVVPPSRLVDETTGEVIGDYELDIDAPVVRLPGQLLELLVEDEPVAELAQSPLQALEVALDGPSDRNVDAYAAAALAGECERVRIAPPGTRNDTLFTVARHLRHRINEGLTLTPTVARDALIAAAAVAGLDETEARLATRGLAG